MALWLKARAYGLRKSTYFSSSQSADDFASHFILSRIDGRTSTFSQEFVDYLRIDSGRKGEASYEARRNLENAISFETPIGPGGGSESNSLVFGDLMGSSKSIERYNEDFEGIVGRAGLNIYERAILVLYYKWGFNFAEIGDLLGVTESRISQRHIGIQTRIRAAEATGSAGKSERTSCMETVLSKKTKEFGKQLEQRAPKEVEEKEFLEMASFDETSF